MREKIDHCLTPKYLGVTLDRTLSYKQHCRNTKQKVSARNNILRKLTGTSWGASPMVLRTSALGLCVSVAEYACPVWQMSSHAKQVDVAVNDMARLVSGCLKPTPIHKLYPIIGIAPPNIRRRAAADAERQRQIHDPRHPLYGHLMATPRLGSRKSFLKVTNDLNTPLKQHREDLWRLELDDRLWMAPSECTSTAHSLDYPIWKTLNRLRVGVTRCKANQQKWGFLEGDDTSCDCGGVQDDAHLLRCPRMRTTCSEDDLVRATDKAISVAAYWSGTV